ncbi:CWF19-like protein 2 [Denticeps clupeoides]|uniref:CWF19-like protein 2 n=1 Tax=Denticeps clupeoides TaxID=299321 RepID=A0AAY4CR38_9TELE|nr:CWF19-like protein 2 [Denticeps clupeoides]
MAAYGGSFESANSIGAKKLFKRKAREEALQKAKEQYEKEERKKALKQTRGEDTWMLPDVDLRLQQIDEEHSSKGKKKKEKKSKKNKKDKKKKAKKEKKTTQDGLSSGSSEDSEQEWVESQPQMETPAKAWKITEDQDATSSSSPVPNNQRDEWMSFDFLSMKMKSVAERRAEKEQEKESEREKARAIEQAGLHKLELNPYWKDGGSGLPTEESLGSEAKKASVVNDGGLSWLRKSYQRMREQAEREQRSLDEVVSERYGSMDQFQKRLKEAEDAVYGSTGGEREKGTERWRKGAHQTSNRDRPLPPPWRDRDHGQDRDRDRSSHQWRDQDRDRAEVRRRQKERDWSDSDRGEDQQKDLRGSRRDRDEQARRIEDREDSSRPRREESGRRGNDQSLFSLSSLKGKFLKPSDSGDADQGSSWAKMQVTSIGFMKPGNEEETHSSAPAWKRITSVPQANPRQESESTATDQKQDSAALVESSETNNKTSSGSEDEDEEEEDAPVLTDEEMNKLGAKLVKAELLGNMALVEQLKSQLAAARKAKEARAQKSAAVEQSGKAQAKVPDRARDDQDVVLFRTDPSGRAWPVNAPTEPLEPKGGRRKKKAVETHRDGERVRYFQDDDAVDLREMVRREKMSSAADQNALYSRMAAKMMGKQDGDNYTLDDMFVSSAAQKERSGREEERQRNRAIQEHRRLAGRMEKCPYCFDNPELPKHLIIAIGLKAYLCVPNCTSLTEGHCLIAPLQHHSCGTGLDEDVWSEIQMFRRALVKLFAAQEQDCVFMETHMNPRRRLHMVYECVPLPRELGDMAPIYFKKAIMESDEEWSMNKKVVDLSSKDIRQAVPKGLPYFSVDFGLQGGFAHVIENEQKFPHYFGKEIIGGMLDLEPRRWRKPARENFDDQRKKVLQFAQWWKPFDCTKPSD